VKLNVFQLTVNFQSRQRDIIEASECDVTGFRPVNVSLDGAVTNGRATRFSISTNGCTLASIQAEVLSGTLEIFVLSKNHMKYVFPKNL
jgi:hypothetical protein